MEYRGGIARGQQLVGRRVVERHLLQRESGLAQRAHVAHRPVENGERGEAEEIELHQPDGLDIVLVQLRDDAGAAFGRIQRAEVGELAGRDEHAAGMHADVARQALEFFAQGEQLPDLILLFLALRQQRLHGARIGQRDGAPGLHRDQLVAEVVAEIEHAAAVAHHRACRHGAEGDDLRHAVRAVLAAHVVDDLVAAVLAEIDVEVRHRHALRVQETLE